MALYELVLRRPDGEEVRHTDQDPGVEGYVSIKGELWYVVDFEEGPEEGDRRYFLELEPPASRRP